MTSQPGSLPLDRDDAPAPDIDAPDVAALEESLRRSHLSDSLTTGALMSGSADQLPLDEHTLPDPSKARDPVPVDLPTFPWLRVAMFMAVAGLVMAMSWLAYILQQRWSSEVGKASTFWFAAFYSGFILLFVVPIAFTHIYRRRYFYRCAIVKDERGRIIIHSPAGQAVLNPLGARVVVRTLTYPSLANTREVLLMSFGIHWLVQNQAGKWSELTHAYGLEAPFVARMDAQVQAFARELGLPLEVLQTDHQQSGARSKQFRQNAAAAPASVGLVDRLQVFGRKVGGMGVVYFCRTLKDAKRAVAKGLGQAGPERQFVLKTSQELLRRGERPVDAVAQFEREAATWLELPPHPNIVQAHGVQRIDDVPYLITDFVEGGSLRDVLRTRARIGALPDTGNAAEPAAGNASAPLVSSQTSLTDIAAPAPVSASASARAVLSHDELALLALQVALALKHATTAVPGLVHGDIKPGNILVAQPAAAAVGVETLLLTDFGLSSVAGMRGHAATVRGGTPAYLAPEAWERDAKPTLAQDIYALGITLFECATGRLPFREPDARAMAAAHRTGDLPPLPADLPRDLADLIRDCVATDPAARPAAAYVVKLLKPRFPQWRDDPIPLTEAAAIDRSISLLELQHPAAGMRLLEAVPLPDRRAPWHYWMSVLAMAAGNPALSVEHHRIAQQCNKRYTRAMGDPSHHARRAQRS